MIIISSLFPIIITNVTIITLMVVIALSLPEAALHPYRYELQLSPLAIISLATIIICVANGPYKSWPKTSIIIRVHLQHSILKEPSPNLPSSSSSTIITPKIFSIPRIIVNFYYRRQHPTILIFISQSLSPPLPLYYISVAIISHTTNTIITMIRALCTNVILEQHYLHHHHPAIFIITSSSPSSHSSARLPVLPASRGYHIHQQGAEVMECGGRGKGT